MKKTMRGTRIITRTRLTILFSSTVECDGVPVHETPNCTTREEAIAIATQWIANTPNRKELKSE